MTDLLSSLTQFYPEHQHSRKHSVTFGHEKRNVGDFVRQFIEAHQQVSLCCLFCDHCFCLCWYCSTIAHLFLACMLRCEQCHT